MLEETYKLTQVSLGFESSESHSASKQDPPEAMLSLGDFALIQAMVWDFISGPGGKASFLLIIYSAIQKSKDPLSPT